MRLLKTIIMVILSLLSYPNFADINNKKDIILESAKSLYIIDGDSVSIKTRIKGIDTPEISQKCAKNNNNIIDCGLLAKNHLKKILNNTKGELKIIIIDVDSYNRLLVKIIKGSLDIAKKMVVDGMAFSYYDYKYAEQQAKKNNKGFWSFQLPPEKPSIWRRKNK